MGRKRSKKNRFHLFLSKGVEVQYFYSPSMAGTDVFYYAIVEQVLRIRFQVKKESFMVIDEIVPLSSRLINKESNKLLSYLMNQEEYAVLISLLGDTELSHAFCLEVAAPLIESDVFSTFPMKMYKDMQNYFNNDVLKYGFYILSLPDTINELPNEEPEEIFTDSNGIEEDEIDDILEEEPYDFIKEDNDIVIDPYIDQHTLANAFLSVGEGHIISDKGMDIQLSFNGLRFTITFTPAQTESSRSSLTVHHITGVDMVPVRVIPQFLKVLSDQYNEKCSILLYTSSPLIQSLASSNFERLGAIGSLMNDIKFEVRPPRIVS